MFTLLFEDNKACGQSVTAHDDRLDLYLGEKIEEETSTGELIKEGMDINKITDIVSDEIVDVIKRQLKIE